MKSSAASAGAERLKIRVICGPTAGGKSALAMRLAERHNAAIISADSRQVYKRFDVGTAKPSEDDQKNILHYGIDIVDPTERYSAAKWASAARRWITDASTNEKVPLIVGGTGLYMKALFEPLARVPELDPARRAKLEEFLSARATKELREWCTLLDPPRAHLGKAQLIRAIETVLLSGERISEMFAPIQRKEGGAEVSQTDSAATRVRGSENAGAPKAQRGQGPETSAPTDSQNDTGLTPSYLLVDPGSSALQQRIERRVSEMLSRGWLDEVTRLSQLISDSAPAWKSAGYEAMREVVRGAGDLSTATQRVIIETRQYAKRQRTWFRHQLPTDRVTLFDPGDAGGDAIVERWWSEAAEDNE